MQSNIITKSSPYSQNKRVLFVPDSIWGDLSGHRSSKHLVKVFNQVGTEVGVYAPKLNHTIEQENELKNSFTYYEQTTYSYVQNFQNSIIEDEFLSVVKDFQPDIVFYMGTIKNKVSMDTCIKHGIKYSYLPLTTEFYCVKDFAGLENGPCFECIKKPISSPFKNKCLGSRLKLQNYIKSIVITAISKPRIINADKIVGYSNDQLDILEDFGAPKDKMIKMPVFFDKETIEGIESTIGDYFVMAGQNITAKGWHIIPNVIKKSKNIKFKLIMRTKKDADNFIFDNDLQEYVNSGDIEMVLYLKTHKEILDVMAKSRGVLVPSYYASTGEFYMIEALGLGKPVILFDSGIHKEIIENEVNGMISKVGDIDDYCENIKKVNQNNNLFNQLSDGSVKLFDELLSFERFKKNVSSLYS